MTLIPLKLYLNEKGKVKLLIGIAKGKKVVDKRQTEKKEIGKRKIKTIEAELMSCIYLTS